MIQTKNKTILISRLAMLIALTLVIQMVGLPQPITGPLINAMLLITVSLLGWISGTILGLMTPVVALLRGQLPAPLAPMVPFIAIGNIVLVSAYYLISRKRATEKTKSPWRQTYLHAGVIAAAIVKFAWLTFAAHLVLPIVLAHSLPPPLLYAMTLPQLVTGLLGGALNILFLEVLNRAGYDYK
ncbi:ECF transporter S component [candidate division KSB1 bacterium]|nr:ECF transporter S component [candidate division KSB1 bacterium]